MIRSERSRTGPMMLVAEGAQHFPAALDGVALQGLRIALRDLPAVEAGVRVHGIAALHPFLSSSGPVGAVAASVLGEGCRPNAGDIWLYATPILHASRPALEPGHRRVLQVDFAAGELPDGLRWLGV